MTGAEAAAPKWRALWYVAPGVAELRTAGTQQPGRGEIVVRTLWSGISRGTERLVFEGRVPESEHARMRGPAQRGHFPFPVAYGYCAVGEVEEGPRRLVGSRVFALHPHQDRFVIADDMVALLPADLPPRRAVLTANMETALNILWDSAAAPGDRIVVVGAGVVGCLVAYLASRLPGADVTLVDVAAERAPLAASLGIAFATPNRAPGDADVVVHASSSPAGLATALDAAGTEGTVVEASWYGEAQVPVALGGPFHSRRLRLVSSQVGLVSAGHRPRWSHARRMAKAVELLGDPVLDHLIGEEISFDDLPAALPRVFAAGAPGLAPVVRYG
jgi:2-desacetyl-2-hydroxyethyl bacteriochlorophyllide A dehydrogenase